MSRPVGTLLAVAALGLSGLAAYSLGVMVRGQPELHGTELDRPVDVGNVVLESGEGRRVSLADFRGKHLLVFFGYTSCPDVCPLTMARLGSAYRALGEPDDLQVVMITVDPENDSPEIIDGYARGFHPAFRGLGGSREGVDAAAARFYIGHRADGTGEVIHGSQVLLVDPSGRFWRVYNDESQLYLESDLRRLVSGRSA